MKRVIQIGGTVRSGTTLHGLILSNRDNAIMLGEVRNLFRPTRNYHRKALQELRKDRKWNFILDEGEQNLYSNIFKEFPDKSIIVDSSKDPFWYRDQVFYNADYEIGQILVYKSLSDLNRSFVKRGQKNIERTYRRYHMKFLSVFPSTCTSHTPSFISDFQYRYEILKYLGLSHPKDILEYWNRKHPNFFGSSSIKKNAIAMPANIGIYESGSRTWLAKSKVVESELNNRQVRLGNDIEEISWGYNELQLFIVEKYCSLKDILIVWNEKTRLLMSGYECST